LILIAKFDGILRFERAVISVWSKIRTNLVVTVAVLTIMFFVRLGVGIPYLMDRRNVFDDKIYVEEVVVFSFQMAIHFLGVLTTWVLASKQTSAV
jgi:hypothetical protein